MKTCISLSQLSLRFFSLVHSWSQSQNWCQVYQCNIKVNDDGHFILFLVTFLIRFPSSHRLSQDRCVLSMWAGGFPPLPGLDQGSCNAWRPWGLWRKAKNVILLMQHFSCMHEIEIDRSSAMEESIPLEMSESMRPPDSWMRSRQWSPPTVAQIRFLEAVLETQQAPSKKDLLSLLRAQPFQRAVVPDPVDF